MLLDSYRLAGACKFLPVCRETYALIPVLILIRSIPYGLMVPPWAIPSQYPAPLTIRSVKVIGMYISLGAS